MANDISTAYLQFSIRECGEHDYEHNRRVLQALPAIVTYNVIQS